MIAVKSAIFVMLDIVLLLRLFAAGVATAHSMRSTNGRVIPGTAKVGASLQITFSSPVSEGDWRIISCHSEAMEGTQPNLECHPRCNSASTTVQRLPKLLEFFNRMSIAGLDRLVTGLPIQ